jgi:hypothetical protein
MVFLDLTPRMFRGRRNAAGRRVAPVQIGVLPALRAPIEPWRDPTALARRCHDMRHPAHPAGCFDDGKSRLVVINGCRPTARQQQKDIKSPKRDV